MSSRLALMGGSMVLTGAARVGAQIANRLWRFWAFGSAFVARLLVLCLEVLGAGLVVAGVWQVSQPAGLVVGGILLVLGAIGAERMLGGVTSAHQ